MSHEPAAEKRGRRARKRQQGQQSGCTVPPYSGAKKCRFFCSSRQVFTWLLIVSGATRRKSQTLRMQEAAATPGQSAGTAAPGAPSAARPPRRPHQPRHCPHVSRRLLGRRRTKAAQRYLQQQTWRPQLLLSGQTSCAGLLLRCKFSSTQLKSDLQRLSQATQLYQKLWNSQRCPDHGNQSPPRGSGRGTDPRGSSCTRQQGTGAKGLQTPSQAA